MPYIKSKDIPSKNTRGSSVEEFVLSSLLSDWIINVRTVDGSFELKVSGTPVEPFLPAFISPTQSTTDITSEFWRIVRPSFEALYSTYKITTDNVEYDLKADGYLTQLANYLVSKVELQAFNEFRTKYQGKIDSPMTYQDLKRYLKLSRQCIYDVVYASIAAYGIRAKIYDFLVTEGKKEATLDFSMGVGGHIFGSNTYLSQFPMLYTVKLDRSDFYIKYLKNWAGMANAIQIHLNEGGVAGRFVPSSVFTRHPEVVSEIASFLSYLATRAGKKIQIYGFGIHPEGFYSSLSVSNYYPTQAAPVDPNMPAKNTHYYEIDPNHLEDFSLKDFRTFLGALFADQQGFFVRTLDMPSGQFLFAFDLGGSLTLEDIVTTLNSATRRPFFPSTSVSFSNKRDYDAISTRWSIVLEILGREHCFLALRRFTYDKDWHADLQRVPILDDRKSSFEELLF